MTLCLDTNILAYAADDSAGIKQAVALDLVARAASRGGRIGLQSIGELQNVLRRRFGKSPADAHAVAGGYFTLFETFPYGRDDVQQALTAMREGRLSYWDALLVSAAGRAGCATMFSEDMQDGARHGSVEVINPFASAGFSARAREILEV